MVIIANRLRREFFETGGSDQFLLEAAEEIDRLQAERDMWQARATAMFWMLPGELTAGELKTKTAQALSAIQNPK